PPLDYYRRVKLPLLRRYGVQAVVEPGRRGFFPAGGGEATLRLGPSTPVPISATDRGSRRGVRIYSIGSTHLDDADVAARQAVAAAERLPADAVVGERVAAVAAADSPGSAVVVAATYENGMAGTTALGERGTPAETVGRRAAEAIEAFEASGGAVDEYLADQSLLVLALAGGELAIPRVTAHIASSVDLLDAFGVDVELDRDGRKTVVRITDPIEAADH
ncbi:MAG: RNA 3'-terminal phosphate cyclase, partial [Halobacteriota archaeon]